MKDKFLSNQNTDINMFLHESILNIKDIFYSVRNSVLFPSREQRQGGKRVEDSMILLLTECKNFVSE